jgi:hypothetical protein
LDVPRKVRGSTRKSIGARDERDSDGLRTINDLAVAPLG